MTLNKIFDIQNLGGRFDNSDEARAVKKLVEKAFEKLCATHGEFAAATGGSWIDIAEYKPVHMDDMTAQEKKKVAVSDARIILRVAKTGAAELRAKLAVEEVARAAKEYAQEARIAANKAEQAAVANAAAIEAATKETEPEAKTGSAESIASELPDLTSVPNAEKNDSGFLTGSEEEDKKDEGRESWASKAS